MLAAIWLAIIFARNDLKKRIIKASIAGGFVGVIVEFWYYQDYWRPPTVFNTAIISVEDFLFGFFITGIVVSIFDAIFTESRVLNEKRRVKFFGCLFLIALTNFAIFSTLLGFNSIIVSTISFIVFTVIILILRKDLFIPAIMSGILTLAVITPIYAVLFNVISPNFWNQYWLLANTKLGLTVLGNIPVTELVWYFLWGCFGGVAYDFAGGYTKISKFK